MNLRLKQIVYTFLVAIVCCQHLDGLPLFPVRKRLDSRLGTGTCRRRRRTVASLFAEYGPYYARRAYRMTPHSFLKLYKLIQPYMGHRKRKRGKDINDTVPGDIKLSIAIRYFAGGDPYDIMIAHGVCHSTVYNSINTVIDAINQCPELKIEYPRSHFIQRSIAAGFKNKSDVAFDNCAGAIDGMLIWTTKPVEKDCKQSNIGAKKFHCSRKGKYGLVFQAVCDHACLQ